MDAARVDAGEDAGGLDGANDADTGAEDGGPPDAGSFDAGPPDTGALDAGPPDTGALDAGPPDTGSFDAGPPDTSVDGGRDVGIDAFSCAGRADCDSTLGCETVLGTITNCLGCADRCVAPANTTALCRDVSGCDWTCNAGYANCDTVRGNGCEINTASNPDFCGSCGIVCTTSGVNVARSCVGGDCLRSCVLPFADCDGDLRAAGSNGCEQSLTTLDNCASCGTRCDLGPTAVFAAPSCASGTCRAVCTPGHLDCDGNQLNGCERTGSTC